MKKKFIFFIFFIYFFSTSLSLAIENKIIVKVGNEIITSYDLENEIKTYLIINKLEINQQNINQNKEIALKKIIGKKIKEKEIKKYNVEIFDQKQLDNYIISLSNNLSINSSLKEFFDINKIDYEIFLDALKTDLKWNSLIFQLYNNQTNINPQELENELNEYLIKNNQIKSFELSEIQLFRDQFNYDLLEEINQFIKDKGFAEAAKKYSIANTKTNGGKLGVFNQNKLQQNVLNLISTLKEGSYTEPYIDDETVIIFKLDKIYIENKYIDEEVIRQNLISQKKEEKLRLFSSSHFTNLENSIKISFQ